MRSKTLNIAPNRYKVRTGNFDDNIISDYENVWQDIDENGWVTHTGTFTVSQNDTQYPNCQVFNTWDIGFNDYACFSWYALVPENFNSKLAFGYARVKLENCEPVKNEASPTILFNF